MWDSYVGILHGNLMWDFYVGILHGNLMWDSYMGILRYFITVYIVVLFLRIQTPYITKLLILEWNNIFGVVLARSHDNTNPTSDDHHSPTHFSEIPM